MSFYNKKEVVKVLHEAALLYKENLEDQKVLFLYGHPSQIKKELNCEEKLLSSMHHYETVFLNYNFLHLTGVTLNKDTTPSAIVFYDKCINQRLGFNDFYIKDGFVGQKLDILIRMMDIKKSANMIGDFNNSGPNLITEKIAGHIYGCIGFKKDENTGLIVPNTLLKKDIRDITIKPAYKIYAILSKNYNDEYYTNVCKIDKSLDFNVCKFEEPLVSLIGKLLNDT